jgi:hypothetical protein
MKNRIKTCMHSQDQDQLQAQTHVIQWDTWWTHPHPYRQDHITNIENSHPCAQNIVANVCGCPIVAR